jgi:hypothetical protein
MVAAALRAVRSNAGDLPSTGLSTVHGHGRKVVHRIEERKEGYLVDK